MKTLKMALLGTTILCGAGALATANAADIYQGEGEYKDEPVAYLPAIGWSGFYVGASVGYGWGDNEVSTDDGFDEGDPFTLSYDVDGLLLGAQLGYNWQRGNLVLGVEAEAGWLGADGDKEAVDAGRFDDVFGETEFGAYGVLAGRLGFASDNALFYVKGGLALAQVETTAGDADFNEPDLNATTTLDETLTGYAIGGGIEYALSSNWSLKGEYLYFNFGDETTRDPNGSSYEHDIDLHTVKLGVNYKFGEEYSQPLK